MERLEALLRGRDEHRVRRARRGARRRPRSSRARSRRPPAGGGARARRPRPRRCASSARRSRSTSRPRRSRAARGRRTRGRSPRGSRRAASRCRAGRAWRPARRRARGRRPPRRTRAARSRSRAWAASTRCACGAVVMPCAETPSIRRVPRAGRHRGRVERRDLLRRRPRHRRRPPLGEPRGDRHLRARRLQALAHALDDLLREPFRAHAGGADHDLAHDVDHHVVEAPAVRPAAPARARPCSRSGRRTAAPSARRRRGARPPRRP